MPTEIPEQRPHGFAVGPTTRLGEWALGLVAAIGVLAVAALTVVPEDSVAAWVVTFSGLALVVAAGVVLFAAFRRSERALSVYVAALMLVGAVLLVALHSLLISD